MSPRRIGAGIGLLIGAVALALQFYLTLAARLSAGDSLFGALWFFFTFFTILSNGMLVLVYLSALGGARWLGWWRAPVTRAMMAGSIAVVMGFYHFMLASLWAPTGLALVTDVLLHYVAPVCYLGWWLLAEPHGRVGWRDIPAMTVFPLIYLGWAMLRGVIVGQYPYPILDAGKLGWGQVAFNCLMMLVLFLAAFAIVVAADRALGRRSRPD